MLKMLNNILNSIWIFFTDTKKSQTKHYLIFITMLSKMYSPKIIEHLLTNDLFLSLTSSDNDPLGATPTNSIPLFGIVVSDPNGRKASDIAKIIYDYMSINNMYFYSLIVVKDGPAVYHGSNMAFQNLKEKETFHLKKEDLN